jgi:TonB family protein
MKVNASTINSRRFAARAIAAGACAALSLALCLAFSPRSRAENAPPHAFAERSGEIQVGAAHTFSLTADMGSVHILPPSANSSATIRYTVHLETDAQESVSRFLFDHFLLNSRDANGTILLNGSLTRPRGVAARNAQFWVQYTVYVPSNLSVEVHTGAGDIETGDIGGHALLVTEGGNITTGRIGFSNRTVTTNGAAAKINTEGGHITVLDVVGDIDAYTAGGFIQARDIQGNAKLHSGGGHIRAAHIKGTAQLETDGGNITVGEAGALVGVRTGGGQIDFGEVHGSVHAETGGGGVRVMYVSGPMEVETSGGGICLTRVSNVVRAATGNGNITAWITPDSRDPSHPVRLPGPSQLASGTGDIVVFLPRNLAATIDASVENGGPDRIEADPALGLNVQANDGGPMHASGALNGGGAVLRLRSVGGKIRLQYVDEQTALRKSLLEEQQHRLAEKLNMPEKVSLTGTGFDPPDSSATAPPKQTAAAAAPCESMSDWWGAWKDHLQMTFLGGVREEPEEFKKLLTVSPSPDYPPVARRAGIQGVVLLQVRAKTDGTLEVEKVLEGEPALVDAARAAVERWRATPLDVCGKKVDVITTLAFNFQLR